MARYRTNLPQRSGDFFLTDGGLETTLIFHEGLDLPEFAAYDLMRHDRGYQALLKYYRTYADLARTYEVGFILESPTWRANADWGAKLGDTSETLAAMNRKAIALMSTIRNEYETDKTRMVLSGCLGPRGDGYNPAALMTEDEAERYHAPQIETFRETEADMVAAITMTHAEEAIGIARAARRAGLPVAISFTVETDGRLPSGQALQDAIAQVDAATEKTPAYFMINCAHPTHFEDVLAAGAAWTQRLRGLRANASCLSHAELDEAEELDEGNPEELARQHRALLDKLGHINILGGCCGTDHRHVEAIYKACV